MTIHAASASKIGVKCKVCDAASSFFGQANVLRKYSASYFCCEKCGFIQTEEPYWLEEAYSSAIALQDVGIIHRNLVNCEITSAILNLFSPEMASAVSLELVTEC